MSDEKWNAQSLRNFWISDDLTNIKPSNWGEFPEGFDPRKVIADIYRWIGGGAVTELGCGYGRLCQSFASNMYTGLDINPSAILKAKDLFPSYEFQLIQEPNELSGGNILMAYTVFLHMPDDVLKGWIESAKKCYKHIVICELLGRDWRNMVNRVPVFNRELQEYIDLLKPFNLSAEIQLPYQRYSTSDLFANQKNTNLSFMVFTKEEALLDGLRVQL